MAENPLIGKQISLISKKNIRYLGTLYSINEQNATVALQNVKSFGTEGRVAGAAAVQPSEDVHPFLVFRGQDITDLHVHEDATTTAAAAAAAGGAAGTAADANAPASTATETAATTKNNNNNSSRPAAPPAPTTTTTSSTTATSTRPAPSVVSPLAPTPSTTSKPSSPQEPYKENEPKEKQPRGGGRGRFGGGGRGRVGGGADYKRGPRPAPGTGASLLNRPARGAVAPHDESLQEDFDFQSNLKEFQDENDQEHHHDNDNGDDGDDEGGDYDEDDAGDEPPSSYEKNDFFDSISCEATDRQSGVDNRLRGRHERDLNTETFGAVALSQRRRRGGGGRGRGGRGRGGRGGGRGGSGGRGRGRGGRGRGGRGGGGAFRNSDGMPGRVAQPFSN